MIESFDELFPAFSYKLWNGSVIDALVVYNTPHSCHWKLDEFYILNDLENSREAASSLPV